MTTPSTTYLLEAIKDLYTKYSDPSQMEKIAVEGLKEKEANLEKFTPEFLSQVIPTYNEDEDEIAVALGDNLSKLALGLITIDDLKIVLPIMSFSEFSPYYGSSSSSSSLETSIVLNQEYLLITTVSSGNQTFESFNYKWTITQHPHNGAVHFQELYRNITLEDMLIGTLMTFTLTGTYKVQLTLTSQRSSAAKLKGRKTAIVI